MFEFSHPNINAVDIDESEIINHCRDNLDPEDVFPESELENWAERNGFIKEGE